uniref:Uncharacterized protein n=1 Tax=Acrobeloides nanus TaxID=290746 RepID=A0A914CZN4_9BILA
MKWYPQAEHKVTPEPQNLKFRPDLTTCTFAIGPSKTTIPVVSTADRRDLPNKIGAFEEKYEFLEHLGSSSL